ncbi:phage tail protein [Pseudomonas sp. P8_250]|uniref:phage tail protein n=1 Tax=Pseudomonas sp. P8_250 TaxID=3043446 RepID=UPI002A3605FE|nr:phage tail protein [Pseudomonas sp. P8_250]MDX9668765.1 phage tail protein [Pseudomonas sp. P8_250]
MAYALPNGSTFEIASALSASKTVTEISNATEAEVTSTAHGLVAGDYIVLLSGWSKLNNRVFKIAAGTADTFTLVGTDTTSIALYPEDQGAGTFKKVTAWVPISQITEVAFAGGEQQFLNFAFLEDAEEKQMPTTKSATSMTLTVADDPNLPYVTVVETADLDLQPRPLRLNLVTGAVFAYNAIVSITSTPTVNRDELMTRAISLSLQARPTRI